jgi:hypothetical protein
LVQNFKERSFMASDGTWSSVWAVMLRTEAYAVTQGQGLEEIIVAIYFLTEKDRAEVHAGRIAGKVRDLKGMQGKSLYRLYSNNPRGWKPRPY